MIVAADEKSHVQCETLLCGWSAANYIILQRVASHFARHLGQDVSSKVDQAVRATPHWDS